MKRTYLLMFVTVLACSVVGLGQDGHLPRAAERTADQPNAEKAKAAEPTPAPKPAADKPTPAPVKADAPAAKPMAKSSPAKPVSAKAPKLIDGIPEGATQLEPYMYSYIDSNGKEWIYRRTPFGVTRVAKEDAERAIAGAAQAAAAPSRVADIKVVENGDDLQFEERNPFGVRKWSKKKTGLTSDEQAAWDRLKRKD